MVKGVTLADLERVYSKYIIKSDDLVRDLINANGLEGNVDELRRIILKYTVAGYDITFALRYDSDVRTLVSMCLSGKVEMRRKPSAPKPPKKIGRTRVSSIRVKKGFYYRGKPRKFTKSEVNFIKFKDRMGVSNKDMFEEFNLVYTDNKRTKTSIVTKRYRIR